MLMWQAARFDERIETIRSTTTELREELKEAREKLEAKVDEAALLSRRLAEAAEKTASHEQEKAALQQELHEAMKVRVMGRKSQVTVTVQG